MRILFLLLLGLMACSKGRQTPAGKAHIAEADREKFTSYWHTGKAEITSYTLDQYRYGEMHTGEAVLIFVTEDFSREKQVKLDRPDAAGKDKINVMKMNFTQSFTTGIYPYSMMLSVFNPIEEGRIHQGLKATASVQEWCGHTFAQINKLEDGYLWRSFSYFESEGDLTLPLEEGILEDELWNLIRLNPAHLPLGKLKIMPGMWHQRLAHQQPAFKEAETRIEVSENGTVVYQIFYPEEKRNLRILFEKNFPYALLGWEESITLATGQTATSRALRKGLLHTDYWNKNKREFLPLRDSLHLR
jgi:hypothetical protein